MKEITMYKCECCNEIYDTSEEALQCESMGKEEQLVNIGDIVEYKVRMGGGFDPLCVEMRVREISDQGHHLLYEFEEYDDELGQWVESGYCMSGVWGNRAFEELCKVKKKN